MSWRLKVKFKLKETWKTINGFLNYEVSTYGNVRNVKTGKILKPFKRSDGYLEVKLYNNIKRQTLSIHTLVAKAFLPKTNLNPDGSIIKGRFQVNHKNEVKTDNNLLNLEYAIINTTVITVIHLLKLLKHLKNQFNVLRLVLFMNQHLMPRKI